MLFNLFLANIPILLYFFFLFCVVFNNFFAIPVVNENAKLKFALAIPIVAPIAVTNEVTEMLPLFQIKQFYQNSLK